MKTSSAAILKAWSNTRMRMDTGLWTSAILVYGLGDLRTTHLALAGGGEELNPIYATIKNSFGDSGVLLAKAAVIGLLFLLYRFVLGRHHRRWAIPAMLSVIGVILTANNLVSYLSRLWHA